MFLDFVYVSVPTIDYAESLLEHYNTSNSSKLSSCFYDTEVL